MTSPLELLTHRLRLRQWQPQDYGEFARLCADPQVMRHFPALLDQAASREIAERMEAAIACKGWGFWVVERHSDGAFIGIVGLNEPAVALPCSPCVEIGWRLAARHWGQGYAFEAAQAALEAGFSILKLGEIVAFTALENQRSRSLMERLGMQPSGQFEHPALPVGHTLRRHWLYRLSAAQWLARNSIQPVDKV